MNSNYVNRINQKSGLSWEKLQQLAGKFSMEKLEEDEIYWQAIQDEKRLELQKENLKKSVEK